MSTEAEPTSTGAATTLTFIFETTHHAMWAEDVAREQAIQAEVVPAPPEADAKCGLALRIPEGQADEPSMWHAGNFVCE